MFSRTRNGIKILSAVTSIPFLLPKKRPPNPNDVPLVSIEEPVKDKHQMTGFERIKKIFELDDTGCPSKELLSAMNTGFFTAFMGGSLGGIRESRLKFEFFVQKYNSETFATVNEAKNVLTRQLAVAFGKGVGYWGSRLGFFTTTFVLITNMLAAYNDKLTLWNFMASGVISGAIYRIPRGVRAMASAGLAGGSLGAFAGCMTLSLLYWFDYDYDQVQQWHVDMRNLRLDIRDNIVRDSERDRVEKIFLDRDQIVKSASQEVLEENNRSKDSNG